MSLLSSSSRRGVVSVAALVVLAVAVVVAARPRVEAPEPPDDVAAAVERTIAAGSARIDATYRTVRGPSVTLTGRVSFRDPTSEVTATVAGGPPSTVRVSADGRAWIQTPGIEGWTPVPGDGRGWAVLLRSSLHEASDVTVDDEGRIVRMRVAPDVDRSDGAELVVRLSGFGTEVDISPP